MEAWTNPLSGFWRVSKLETRSRRDPRSAAFLGPAVGTCHASSRLFCDGRLCAGCVAVRCGCNLEKNDSPVIITSQRTGLPTPRYHNANAIKTLTTPPAPEPDMKSQAVLAAQPKSIDALPKIESEAREARAEAALHGAQPQNNRVRQPIHYQQPNMFDRFSIKAY